MQQNDNQTTDCKHFIDCFNDLTEIELFNITDNKLEVSYKKGEIIAKQGGFTSHIIYVKSGLIKQYIEDKDDKNNLILNVFGTGKLIGISSIFGDSVFRYSLATLEDSVICLLEMNTIRKLASENIKFSNTLLKSSNKKTLFAYNRIFNHTQKHLAGKISSVFIYLSEEVYYSKKFKLSLSRSELAGFAGVSRMSTIKILNELKKDNIITEKNNYIEIIDLKALKHLSKIG